MWVHYETILLKKIINIKDINNIEKNINFDYFRITNLENRLFIKAKHVLFFPFYISQQDLKNGWYLNKYDLRKHILEIYDKHPNYTFVIEENMLVDVPDCMHFIVVDNIMLTIDKIFDFMLSEFKGKTILVTGSVGKTSTVGMLESVLKASNKSVLRIYSKRITPLVLKSYIINFVTPELEYIVMEAEMFYKKHIPYFSKTMKTYLSIILNVEKEHLGVNGIDTIDDIVENKAELIRYSKYAIVNGRDERLSKLKHKSNSIYYKNKKLFDTDLSLL